ncbi:ABC transporter ATP-binding protein/permease [Brevibacterium sp. 91QC2O2]|jgi:ATP-binding cassette subfamily B multidrug efflux pump|uniref:ABC transporter ATP-binding protein n=1 Tax=Brevibacterium sp. 91QC2O2 TaxID=2968458 RepID=UPI00211C0122|nr:ABC transporter ATP-binding protein [Brevibacterium sp. 91QC2O2]MCQ9366701.1 ABC transporter ATP-binding protein/permease [Brevibacterium sp. 91QC2O2]
MSEQIAPGQKAGDVRGTLRRLGGVFRPYAWRAGLSALTLVLGTVLTIAAPYVLGRATDLVFSGFVSLTMRPGQTQAEVVAELRAQGAGERADMVAAMHLTPGLGVDFPALARLLCLVVLIHIVSGLLNWWGGYIANSIIQRVMSSLRADIEDKIQRLPLSVVDSKAKGDLLSRLNNDIDNLNQTLNQSAQDIVSALVMFLGVLGIMFVLSWQLALVAVATIPLTVVVIALLGTRSQRQFRTQWKSTGELNTQVEESITGAALLQVYGALERTQEAFAVKNAEVYRASFRAQALSGAMMPAMSFVSNLVFVGIALLGALQVASGQLTLGTVQAFIQYARQFAQPLQQLGGMASQLQSALASAERVFALLDEADEPAPPSAHPDFAVTRGRVAFEHVDFAYRPDTPLIEDLSLVAEPGQTVAIVGHTGAGKTTMVNLLLRFYEPTAGRITLDGIDTAQLTRDQVRAPIGMVLQDTWLFEGTIYDNIAYGLAGATREQVMTAAKEAYVDQFVAHLPDGYDTVITETADNISAGQRQLITIARAFVSQPQILVLDEATSSVDTRTEVLVQKAMNRLRSGRTSFVIAHRLSTIQGADLIIVMDAGHIVEQGTHAQLMAAGGVYAGLQAAQSGGMR